MKLRTVKLLVRLNWWRESLAEMFGLRKEKYFGYQKRAGSPCQYYVLDNSGLRTVVFSDIPEGRFVTFTNNVN